MLLVLYCVIYSAEPCWVGFCRKVKVRPWWPWWFCRWSIPAVESRRRSMTRLLCLQRVNTTSHTTGKHIHVGQTTDKHAMTFIILFIFVHPIMFTAHLNFYSKFLGLPLFLLLINLPVISMIVNKMSSF